MPSDKFKLKNNMIKKLYNSRKKLLGRSDKSDKCDKTGRNDKNDVNDKNDQEKIEKLKISIENTSENLSEDTNNIYENIQGFNTLQSFNTTSPTSSSSLFKNVQNEVTFIEISETDSKSISNCDELSLSTYSSTSNASNTSNTSIGNKTSIYLSPETSISSNFDNNVTIIQVQEEDSCNNKPITDSCNGINEDSCKNVDEKNVNKIFNKNKLEIIIDNFDKIYNEHKQDVLTNKPKLIKSKTCSIIESKCILKKKPDFNENPIKIGLIKTKSLFNLDVDNETLKLCYPNADVLKLVGEFNQLKLNHEFDCKLNDRFKNKSKNEFKNDSKNEIKNQKQIEKETVKVKEIVKKLNNITSKSMVKTNLKDSDEKLIYKPQSKIPKATSCNDLSNRKLTVSSKIPIKSNLNKTFPSTPNNLEKLDLNLGCTKTAKRNLSKAQSTQSLVKASSKESLIKNKSSINHKINSKNPRNVCKHKHNLKDDVGNVDKEDFNTNRNEVKIDKKLQEIDRINLKIERKDKVLSKISSNINNISNNNNSNNNYLNLKCDVNINKDESTSSSESTNPTNRNHRNEIRTEKKLKEIDSKNKILIKSSINNNNTNNNNSNNNNNNKNSSLINSKNQFKSNQNVSNVIVVGKLEIDTNPTNKKCQQDHEEKLENKVIKSKDINQKELEKDQSTKSVVQKGVLNVSKKEGKEKIKTLNHDLRKTWNLTSKLQQPNLNQTLKTTVKAVEEGKTSPGDAKKINGKTSFKNPKTKSQINKLKETKSNQDETRKTVSTLPTSTMSTFSTFGEIKTDLKPKFVDVIDDVESIQSESMKLRSLKRSDTYKVVEKNHLKRLQETEANLKISKELMYRDFSGEDFNSDDSGNISNDLEFDELQFKPSTIIFSSNESLNGINKLQNEEEKIFFRTGVLTQLESQRDEKLAGMVINLQANCRGFLARKKLSQRKLQDLAVRCIQRNVRKFMLVRDWAWWRLLVRVTPLLNVHRTEEELKLKTEELELLKMKLEKIEADRNNLKSHNDKLEAKLSEMTVDLAEEHSTSTLAAERLDVETAERIRLERELTDMQQKNKNLQTTSEKLEMELLYARSDLNHHHNQQTSDDDEEDAENEPVYKQRYERVVRELEFTKRRLRQQHEDDLEQLVGLKKQLEKKLTDAYEEVEEQRQVVGQWKRKVQKLTSEMGDIKLLLEEQISRNNMLEKKQRKFDSEVQNVQEEWKKERQSRDRLSREKELLTAEKFGLEGTVGDLRMELDMKEEKLHALEKELEELTFGGKTEEEVAVLRKQKIDCERRLHDQEEELDELAGQVQLLEQAKLKLEMSLEQQRKAAKKEAQQHEEELEEVRCNSQKKVKALEAQLENEHEERTVLLREKHELERRLANALENDRNDKAVDEAVVQRLKRDLKRTKALLRDTQMQLDRQRAENPSKTLIRQLRNQIEDLECARTTALKTKQTLETDLSEIQSQLDETTRIKSDLEEKYNANLREKTDLQNQLEENEEELAEVLKKYKTIVQQMSLDQIALQEQVALVAELETEKSALKEQLVEMSNRLETVENMGDASSNVLVRKNEMKVKELEHKLDLEQTTRQRLEVQISRLKEAVEKLQNELGVMRNKEQGGQELIRKLQRQIRELREEHNSALTKEGESILKRKEIEKRYEALEAETTTVRADLRLALKRIEDLQAVIQNDLEDSSEQSDSEIDSLSSEDSVNSFLKHHKLNVKPTNTQIESTKPRSTSVNSIKDTSYA